MAILSWADILGTPEADKDYTKPYYDGLESKLNRDISEQNIKMNQMKLDEAARLLKEKEKSDAYNKMYGASLSPIDAAINRRNKIQSTLMQAEYDPYQPYEERIQQQEEMVAQPSIARPVDTMSHIHTPEQQIAFEARLRNSGMEEFIPKYRAELSKVRAEKLNRDRELSGRVGLALLDMSDDKASEAYPQMLEYLRSENVNLEGAPETFKRHYVESVVNAIVSPKDRYEMMKDKAQAQAQLNTAKGEYANLVARYNDPRTPASERELLKQRMDYLTKEKPQVVVNTAGQVETEGQKELARLSAKDIDQTYKDASSARRALDKINRLEKHLEIAGTGALEKYTVDNLRSIASSLGIPLSDKVTAAAAADAILKQFQLDAQQFMKGQVSDREGRIIEQSMPTIGEDKTSILKKLADMKAAYRSIISKGDAARETRMSGTGNIQDIQEAAITGNPKYKNGTPAPLSNKVVTGLGANPRYPNAVWMGDGWYVKRNGKPVRVE